MASGRGSLLFGGDIGHVGGSVHQSRSFTGIADAYLPASRSAVRIFVISSGESLAQFVRVPTLRRRSD